MRPKKEREIRYRGSVSLNFGVRSRLQLANACEPGGCRYNTSQTAADGTNTKPRGNRRHGLNQGRAPPAIHSEPATVVASEYSSRRGWHRVAGAANSSGCGLAAAPRGAAAAAEHRAHLLRSLRLQWPLESSLWGLVWRCPREKPGSVRAGTHRRKELVLDCQSTILEI